MSEEKVNALLKEHGAILIRDTKHEVWKFPDGKMFVRAKTPSDRKVFLNQLQDLRKILDLSDERGQIGERREKKISKGRAETFHYTRSINTLADKLRESGVTENYMQEHIDILQRQNTMLIQVINTKKDSWFVRLKNKLKEFSQTAQS